jgi:hypothetical protein
MNPVRTFQPNLFNAHLAYFPNFEKKIKEGLSDHLAVCLCICLCLSVCLYTPPNFYAFEAHQITFMSVYAPC